MHQQNNHLRRSGAAIVAALMLALLGACASRSTAESDDAGGNRDEAGVRAASAGWDAAHNAGDAARLSALYVDTAVSMPYNRPAIQGRTAIAQDFREFFAGFKAHHATTIESLQIAGDRAIERGRYELKVTPRAGGETVIEVGKHIVIRRQVNGAWLIESEIWNTDAPPPAA